MKYLFMDTSALMHGSVELQELINEENAVLVICSTVLEELDGHKDSNNGEKKYKARQAFKLINNNPNAIQYVVDEVPKSTSLTATLLIMVASLSSVVLSTHTSFLYPA